MATISTLISQLVSQLETLQLEFTQLESRAAAAQYVSTELSILQQNSLIHYLNSTTRKSRAGLKRGDIQEISIYRESNALSMELSLWRIVASINIQNTSICLAHNGAASLCALMINDMTVCVNNLSIIMDQRPERPQFPEAWFLANGEKLTDLVQQRMESLKFNVAAYISEPQTEQTEDTDEELQRLIADRANEKASKPDWSTENDI